jgi:aldehyde:ferredoxin oxidoreductase
MQPLLTINLTTRQTASYTIPADWQRDYLGGASLAARLLYDSLTAELDPLSPDAPLLFLNGPLSGTAGPATGRFVVCGKSPATHLWAESNCGGFWGPELRAAGFDGVWITGQAAAPVYLWIHDGEAELRDAAPLWGLDPYAVQERLSSELGSGKIHVASIGMAGEARIPFSLILTDHGRVAGRTGLGAVMGAKRLKAIAVHGSGRIPVADLTAYMPLRSDANKQLRSDNMTVMLRQLGTGGAADFFDYMGSMPKKYYQQGTMDGVEKISGASMSETILKGVSACHACVIACGRVVHLDGDAPGSKRKGPEYETMVGFGPNLLIDDLAIVTRLGDLCDRYGMDTISMSNTLGLAFTLFERGLLSEADAGMPLRWGDAAAVETLIHQTARRQGLGNFLADGARALAARFGAPGLAVQVNGLEVAYHDPRGFSGMALVYATSPRGACHNQSDYFLVEMGQTDEALGLEMHDPRGGAEKAANVARHQDWRTVCNALVMCILANVPAETVVTLVNIACGFDLTLHELLLTGERAWNLKRLINGRLGLTAANDTLPELLLKAYAEGGAAAFAPDLPAMLAAYYAVRGWDPITGMPTPETRQRVKVGKLKVEG